MDINKLTQSIQSHEGLRLKPYYDTVGKLTIGYGRNLTDVGISAAEANYLLGNDIQSAIRTSQAQDWWPYVCGNDVWENVFIELIFNMGAGGVANFKTMLACAKAGDGVGAGNALLDSTYARQVGKRARDLAAMLSGN